MHTVVCADNVHGAVGDRHLAVALDAVVARIDVQVSCRYPHHAHGGRCVCCAILVVGLQPVSAGVNGDIPVEDDEVVLAADGVVSGRHDESAAVDHKRVLGCDAV